MLQNKALHLAALFALSLQPISSLHAELESAEEHHEEARPFDAERDAEKDVAVAMSRAMFRGVNTLIVMGANWCHDSRGLATHLESERFAPMIAANFELVYVDVGKPQRGKGRNLDIAGWFGVEDITGTPNVLIVSPEGRLLNTPKDAKSWRNADSRDADDIFEYFSSY